MAKRSCPGQEKSCLNTIIVNTMNKIENVKLSIKTVL